MAKTRSDVESGVDHLYQLPLAEFVQARNDLASQLRGDGDTEAALRVQSLAKPPLSAWAVNQVYWHARPAFDSLARAGQRLRTAQQAALAGRGADVRDASKARDAALVAALEAALDLLQRADHSPTPAMRLRIATNLEALAAYGGRPPAAAPGRLAEDLDPPGFEVFTGMRGGPEKARKPEPDERHEHRPATAKVVSFEAIAKARKELAEAERAASERRADAHRAEAALEDARAAVKAARGEVDRARTAWEEANRRAEQAERRVPEHEEAAKLARRAADEAAAGVERARAALDALKRQK